jgi:hypothetical protein
LSGLQKLGQRTKKCIELREEYVEQMPSLVAVACFLPGRAKDVSASHRIVSLTLVSVRGENVDSLKIRVFITADTSFHWTPFVVPLFRNKLK